MAQIERATSSGGRRYLKSGMVTYKEVNAEFIKADVVNAEFIKADDIVAKTIKMNRLVGDKLTLGGIDNVSGELEVLDATGTNMVNIDKLGITLSNGAKLIGSDGVLSEFIFSNDWQTLGWVNDGGTGVKYSCSMSIFIPTDIQIVSAILYVDIASRYVTDPLDLTTVVDGYYSPTSIKLYTAVTTPKIYLNYPVSSSANLITSEAGALNSNFGTWNPTAAETIQLKNVDITDKVSINSKFLVKLTAGVTSPTLNQTYTDGGLAKMELVIIGYKK